MTSFKVYRTGVEAVAGRGDKALFVSNTTGVFVSSDVQDLPGGSWREVSVHEALEGCRFTYYCETHRDQTTRAPAPSARVRGGLAPSCPLCAERMFWVPNGGTSVPAASWRCTWIVGGQSCGNLAKLVGYGRGATLPEWAVCGDHEGHVSVKTALKHSGPLSPMGRVRRTSDGATFNGTTGAWYWES